jgi:neutral amino acid transport system ATP-binding protein
MRRPLLEVDGLTKVFGGVCAVDNCSLVVPEGSITGLIGPNGSGKSTLLNMVSGYLAADTGEVRFEGNRIDRLGPAKIYRAGVSRTFQRARVFPDMTVRQNMLVAAPLRLRSIFRLGASSEIWNRANELLDGFRLLRFADVAASELSYGQQKLLEFASVLMGRPRLLLLDEPTAGVNATLIEVMADRILALREAGVTIAVVEHNMEFIMRLCDPIVVLDQGSPIFQGTAVETQSSQLVLDAYLGA